VCASESPRSSKQHRPGLALFLLFRCSWCGGEVKACWHHRAFENHSGEVFFLLVQQTIGISEQSIFGGRGNFFIAVDDRLIIHQRLVAAHPKSRVAPLISQKSHPQLVLLQSVLHPLQFYHDHPHAHVPPQRYGPCTTAFRTTPSVHHHHASASESPPE